MSLISTKILQHFLNIPVIQFPPKVFPYPAFSLKSNDLLLESDYSIADTILGKQAEAIFEHIIRLATQYKLIASNEQIQGKTATIGELDYLIQDLIPNTFSHVEVACKFYLFDPTIEDEYEGKWIGPNRKDTLKDKLTKLKQKQFPLLQRPELEPLLARLHMKASQFLQQHYIVTSLYIPKSVAINTLPQHYQDCVIGTWTHFKDLYLKNDCLYAMPDKKQWLLPEAAITNWLNKEDATKHIEHSIAQKRAVHVYEKNGELIHKFFVVWW